MTTELKVHKVMLKANELAQSVANLTRKTEFNDMFRRQHEERMQKMWCDVLAVRANLQQYLETSDKDRLGMKEYWQEVVELKSSIGQVRKSVEELASKVSELPTLSEADAVLAAVVAQREACQEAAARCESVFLGPSIGSLG
jgi:methyl-accepting chemotaxis protein